MAYSAGEQVGDVMHGIMGGLSIAVALGMADGRARNAQRREHAARCGAAARAAEGRVYAATAAGLRERLADAEEDVAFLQEENATLQGKVDTLCAFITAERAAGRMAA